MYLTGASIVYLTQFLLTGTILAYLVSRQEKIPSTRYLAVYFFFNTLFTLVNFLEVSLSPEVRYYFLCFQLFPVFAGLVPLLQFSYSVPLAVPPRHRGAKTAKVISLAAAVWSGGIALNRMYRFAMHRDPSYDTVPELILLAGMYLWMMAILAGRAFQAERDSQRPGGSRPVGWIKALLWPTGRESKVLVDFGRTVSLPFWFLAILLAYEYAPVSIIEILLEKFTGFPWEGYLGFIILYIGQAVFFLALSVTYINHATEPTAFMIKLVGLSLWTFTILLGIGGLYLGLLFQGSYSANSPTYRTIRFVPERDGSYLILPLTLQAAGSRGDQLDPEVLEQDYATLVLPFPFPFYGETYTQTYVLEDGVLGFDPIPEDNVLDFLPYYYTAIAPYHLRLHENDTPGQGVFASASSEKVTISWQKLQENNADDTDPTNTFGVTLYPDGRFDLTYHELTARQIFYSDTHRRQHFTGVFPGGNALPTRLAILADLPAVDDKSNGFLDPYSLKFRIALHQQMLPIVYLLTLGTIFILVFFPKFFQANLLAPLNDLQEGMREVNDGNLSVVIIPRFKDELGFISQVFNTMAQTLRLAEETSKELNEALRDSNEKLENLNSRLENRVKERTAQLEEAVTELEALSYSVSHSMRAPMRAIDGYSSLLQTGYESELPAEAQRYIHLVRENAAIMNRLVDELLDFIQLGRTKPKIQPIDTESLVKAVLEHFQEEIQQRQVQVKIDGLPDCEADHALLLQVYNNLISNSLKFTRVKEYPSIEIGAKTDDRRTVYFVHDNGVGFDMQYAHKLFGVFQRLHLDDEYEGVGIGLAIVQRIVHLHDGEIWAESELNHGATIHFTLGPAPQVP